MQTRPCRHLRKRELGDIASRSEVCCRAMSRPARRTKQKKKQKPVRPTAIAMSLTDAIQIAIRLHQQGQLEDAIRLYGISALAQYCAR